MAVQRLNTGRSAQFLDDSGSGANFGDDRFVATPGQTLFTLSAPYLATGLSVLFVNGAEYDVAVDYTIAGTTVTWLNTSFALEAGDVVTVKYQK